MQLVCGYFFYKNALYKFTVIMIMMMMMIIIIILIQKYLHVAGLDLGLGLVLDVLPSFNITASNWLSYVVNVKYNNMMWCTFQVDPKRACAVIGRTCSGGEERFHDGDAVVPCGVVHRRVALIVHVVDARQTAVDVRLHHLQ